MMLYHSLFWSILLIQFFHRVKSKTYNRDFRSYAFQSNMKQTTATIVENNKNQNSFERKLLFNISSSNSATYDYKLLPGTVGVDNGYFNLVNSGKVGDRKAALFQERKVDYEIHPNFTIYAGGFDANENKVETDDVSITIFVVDVNDEKPVFISSSLFAEIPENRFGGFFFFKLRATDADSETDFNGVVRYSIVAGSEQPSPPNGQARFLVNKVGRVSLRSSIDREAVSQINFLVLAMDGPEGGPGFTTTGTATVNIVDINDNPPVFTMNPYPTVSIGEFSSINVRIMVVEATDEDIGLNKVVNFEIILGDSNGHFHINSQLNKDGLYVGSLTIQSPLDFETQSSYQLTILAKNKDANENAETLTSTTVVAIKVIDENDPPVFVGEPYSATVTENNPSKIIDLVKVKAEDFDFNGNQTISYRFANSEPWFSISDNGIISTNDSVDREHASINQDTSEYVLLVTATDDYIAINATATTSVIITIIDKNDNPPEKGYGWNTILCETPSEKIKRNVTLITVKDKDSYADTIYVFEILEANSKFSLNYKSRNSRYVLTIESNFDKDDVYQIPIRVTDRGAVDIPSAKMEILTLTIRICSCNGNYIPDCSLAGSLSKNTITFITLLPFLILGIWFYLRRNKRKKKKQDLSDEKGSVKTNSQSLLEENGDKNVSGESDIST